MNRQPEEGFGSVRFLLELAGDAQQAALGHPRHGMDGAQAAFEGVPVFDRVDVLHPVRVAEILGRRLMVGADRLVEDNRPIPGVEPHLDAERIPEIKEQERVRLVGFEAGNKGPDGCIRVERPLFQG